MHHLPHLDAATSTRDSELILDAMTSPFESRIAAALEDLAGPSKPSLRAVEKKHGVSRRTLKRCLNGGVSKQIARSAQQLLTIEQENSLVAWILALETEGHAPTHGTVRQMAAQIVRVSGGPEQVGRKWLSRFLTRHPELRSKIGKNIEVERIQNTNSEDISTWFSHFRRVQVDYKVAPENIWNMDETGVALGACMTQKVIGSSSSSRIYKKTPENREWVSIVELVSVTGQYTRCLVIFKGQNVQSSLFKHDKVPDWLYTCSENEWTSNNIGIQ